MAGNDYTAFNPSFWALETILALEKNVLLPGLVHRDFEPVLASQGDTVKTRKPGTFVANDKTNGSDVTVQDATATNVDVVLNKHKEVTFLASDRDIAIALPNLIQTEVVPAAIAIAEQIDLDLWTAMSLGFAYSSGTAGTTPSTLGALSGVRKVMNTAKVPFGDRVGVIGPAAEDKFLQLDAFINQNYVGDGSENEALKEALLGRKLGFTLAMDQTVDTGFASPNSTAALVNNGPGYAIGTTTIAIDDGASPLGTAMAAGDLVTFAAGQQSHVVVSCSTTSLVISPGLRVAVINNQAITVVGKNTTYQKNPFFHKNAVALVTRLLPSPEAMGAGVRSSVMSHKGLAIRALMAYDQKKLGWQITLDVLYGIKVLDVELGCMLLG